LIQNFEHVEFTRRFLNYFPDDMLRVQAEAAYADTAAGSDLEPAFNNHLLPLFRERGVLDRLVQQLRTDRQVTINSAGPLLAATNAAQLNQVMAFAVLEAAKQAGRSVARSSGLVTDVTASAGSFQVSGPNSAAAPFAGTFEHVILRHGPNRLQRYAPVGNYFDRYKAHVTNLLSSQPTLNAPPTLDPETYDFFEALRIAKLEDQASRLASQASVALAKITLILGADPAAHISVEQGGCRLFDVADQCERLTGTVNVHLALAPAKLPVPVDVVRLARASGGRIVLAAHPEVLAAWQNIEPTIIAAAASTSHYPARALNAEGLAGAIDTCLLRLLDQRVAAVIASHNCDTLGPLSPSIASAIEPTWTAWRASLGADKKLLGTFLRWLANVEQVEHSPWNGDHARIPGLATALVMMLATHHGEPLAPALVDRGNLKFNQNAVALGSGCELVGRQPLAVWDQPDQWGVDALILSGSAEVEVADPAGRVIDGGTLGTGLATARRVRPVVIRNDRLWRGRLTEDLAVWQAAVAAEFAALRERQDQELEDLSK
jgi:hypothetical protein